MLLGAGGVDAGVGSPLVDHGLRSAVASSTESDLDILREAGDLAAQRRHAWDLLVQVTGTGLQGDPVFESWYGEGAVFGDAPVPESERGIRGFARDGIATAVGSQGASASQSADASLLTYTLYNRAAYEHIRRNGLNRQGSLERLRSSLSPLKRTRQEASVPPFPRESMVLKTAWWPVAGDRPTPVPVWDSTLNPVRAGGNDYLTWVRVIGIDPSVGADRPLETPLEFAGRSFTRAPRVGLSQFYSVRADSALAARVMQDRGARKSALISLGRPIQAGDYLVLVGANLATREIQDWVWAAFWWHDRAGEGAFADGRPLDLKGEWRNYLMQVAFDYEKPAGADGGPHICFNPWFEGRFPRGPQGAGTQSNCLACHQRASYPAVSFLPVLRGAPDRQTDPAYAPGQLRTSFLWSLALHAR